MKYKLLTHTYLQEAIMTEFKLGEVVTFTRGNLTVRGIIRQVYNRQDGKLTYAVQTAKVTLWFYHYELSPVAAFVAA